MNKVSRNIYPESRCNVIEAGTAYMASLGDLSVVHRYPLAFLLKYQMHHILLTCLCTHHDPRLWYLPHL